MLFYNFTMQQYWRIGLWWDTWSGYWLHLFLFSSRRLMFIDHLTLLHIYWVVIKVVLRLQSICHGFSVSSKSTILAKWVLIEFSIGGRSGRHVMVRKFFGFSGKITIILAFREWKLFLGWNKYLATVLSVYSFSYYFALFN
jgi:hypothetical protein